MGHALIVYLIISIRFDIISKVKRSHLKDHLYRFIQFC